MASKGHSYRPVSSSDDISSSISAEDRDFSNEKVYDQPRPGRNWSRWVSVLLLGFSVVLNFVFIALITTNITQRPTDQKCAKQLSVYSPAIEAVEYIEYDFAAEFNSTNKYRGLPTPEREDAWYNLTYKHAVEIPASEIAGLNRSESDNLKHVPEEVGTGYVAILEVFHQLHCLNMIRMFTWYQAGKYPGIPDGLTDSALKNRMHVDHCIDALRIAIQCFGDVTPVFVRLGGHAGAKADFNSHHKCRNFDKLESWIDSNWSVN